MVTYLDKTKVIQTLCLVWVPIRRSWPKLYSIRNNQSKAINLLHNEDDNHILYFYTLRARI
jgi:hypothetical protein